MNICQLPRRKTIHTHFHQHSSPSWWGFCPLALGRVGGWSPAPVRVTRCFLPEGRGPAGAAARRQTEAAAPPLPACDGDNGAAPRAVGQVPQLAQLHRTDRHDPQSTS